VRASRRRGERAPAARLAVLAAGVVATLLLPVPARAGLKAGEGEIGFDYGWQRFDSRLLGKGGDRWSVRGGRLVTDRLEWEGQISRGEAKDTPLPGAERRITLTEAVVNVVLNFHPRREVVPYLLAGDGIAKTELEAVSLRSSDTEAGYQIGGGARFFLGDDSRVAGRVEITIGGADAFERSYVHPAVAAGLTFRIGRRP